MYNRLLSLDVFRGLTIALMIIVNSPGNHTSYSWIAHSPWNGCTLADLVFPFFILILGMSACFSLHKALAKGIAVNRLINKILKRTLMLFAIGLLLNAFPHHFDYSTLRILGVLQRIAICYFVAAILYLTTSIKLQAFILVVLLVLYWLIMTVIPIPHFGIPSLSPEGNLAAYVDQLLFSPQHLYAPTYDPEGFLSTFPSLATALMGNLTAFWLLSSQTKQRKLFVIGLTGGTAALLGWFWGITFPINKTLWSSSYVLWTGGLGLLLFAIIYWLIEIQEWRKWSKPFLIFGTNALIAYFLHVFFLKLQAMIFIRSELGKVVTLKLYLTQQLFSFSNLSLKGQSLFYAVSYMFFWLVILSSIYPKKRLDNAIGSDSYSSIIR